MMTQWMPVRQMLVFFLGAFVGATVAAAASPSLTVIIPRGVQRGGEHLLTFSGARLEDAQEVFFYEAGFEVTKIEPDGANRIKVSVKVAPDCRLGEHVAQVRTASGISDYRTLYVGDLPALGEKEPNNDFQSPQAVSLNVTVNGIIQSEDVDFFLVEARKGQRLSVEVEGMRLGTTLFDPYVAVMDAKGNELAAVDDMPLLLQDCATSIRVPQDGRYVILVRDSSYGGNGNAHYRLHVGTFPRPTAIYPAGGKLGESLEVSFLGDAMGELRQTVQLPSEMTGEFGLVACDDGGTAPSPNPLQLSPYGNAFELEPNDSRSTATPVELPLAFNGILQLTGDVDFFKFQAKKGEQYDVECYARRIRSVLDPVIYLYDANGRTVGSNDDSRGPDSYLRFNVPADGDYFLRVGDHLSRGGPEFVYRVEFTSVAPKLTLGIPRVQRYSQYRQTIFVPRGNRFGTVISANRENFSGDLVLTGDNLPDGMTIIAEPMPANLNSMPVVFEAAADAPLAGDLVDFMARHAEPAKNIRGGFVNRADFVIGQPGQSLYRWKDVNRLAMAVVEEGPFRLEIVEPKVPLVRNGSMQLRVVAQRKEGFTAPINVQFPFRPPGVGAASSVNIPEGQNEVDYPLSADGNAQIKKWKVFALGSAEINGSVWASSQLANLEVADPHVTLTMQRASCEQAQETNIYCTVHLTRPFEGRANAQLLGLPPKVTVPDVQFQKDTHEFVFKVKTEADSPVGRHRNLFCQLTITENGEPIVSRAGTVELQIDKPLPQKPSTQPEPKTVAQTAPPPTTRPLTRLEKLRQEALQRAESNLKDPNGPERGP